MSYIVSISGDIRVGVFARWTPGRVILTYSKYFLFCILSLFISIPAPDTAAVSSLWSDQSVSRAAPDCNQSLWCLLWNAISRSTLVIKLEILGNTTVSGEPSNLKNVITKMFQKWNYQSYRFKATLICSFLPTFFICRQPKRFGQLFQESNCKKFRVREPA